MSTLPALSALVSFDDLMRRTKELTSGIAEEKFLLFLQQYEMLKLEYHRIVEDAKDIQSQLDDQQQQTIALERKLNYARKMVESERKSRREAEAEKEQLEAKLDTLRTLLLNDNMMKDETRKHLQVLSSYARKRKSLQAYVDEDACDHINSTGSILSDLSLTQSGDDLLDAKPSTHGKWKKHRPSLNTSGVLNVSNARKTRASAEKRRSARRSILEYGPTDKIVTQTKFTIPIDKRAPIHAESLIESIPNVIPTPSTSSSEEVVMVTKTPMRKRAEEQFKTPSHLYPNISKAFATPSAPSIDDIDKIEYNFIDFDKKRSQEKTPTKTNINHRAHSFTSKTFLKPETCGGCKKKIRFGSAGLRCSECRTCVHNDCRDHFSSSVNCFPQKSTPIAQKTANGMGLISDYTPQVAPMVPALIVHCVNEIEMRGLREVGLYRISGSDRDVKALKAKFLKNNGIPNIGDLDVHVLCCCIKDFLRSLRENLIPMSLWTEFSNAAQQVPDDDEIVGKSIIRAVEKLPQSNRDTLAYLIMHFQRIADCPEVKMPLSNFAKIFGPTIVGYSCAEPDTHLMFAETLIQVNVMMALLSISTQYWNKFISLDQLTKDEEEKEIKTYGSKFYQGTPSLKIIRNEKKFYNTPPYSAISKKKK